MGTWILIAFAVIGYGAFGITAEFNTEKACKIAIVELKEVKSWIKAICVLKGEVAK